MPGWLLNLMMSYVAPAVITALTPIIVEYMKRLSDYLRARLPGSAWAALSGVVASLVYTGQAQITGMHFPPLVEYFVPLMGVFFNELGADFGKQPPTPGI